LQVLSFIVRLVFIVVPLLYPGRIAANTGRV